MADFNSTALAPELATDFHTDPALPVDAADRIELAAADIQVAVARLRRVLARVQGADEASRDALAEAFVLVRAIDGARIEVDRALEAAPTLAS